MAAQAQKYQPLYDIDLETGVSIEVFYADRTLETFGRSGAGWFWWPRQSNPCFRRERAVRDVGF
jgi:hypothetical protein